MKNVSKVLALALVAALGAVSLVVAGEKELVAGGYCPVAYVKMHKAVKGDPQIRSGKDGHVYQFANAMAKQAFDAYKIDGVPTLGIHGRWFTSGSLTGSNDRALAVADYLIQRARKPG